VIITNRSCKQYISCTQECVMLWTTAESIYVQAHFKSSVIIVVVISEKRASTVRRVRQRSNSINGTPTMFPSPGFYIRTVATTLAVGRGDFRSTITTRLYLRLLRKTSVWYWKILHTTIQVSLRHLARTFEMILSCWRSTALFKGSQPKVGSKYLMEASEYKDERLLESAQRLCTDNFEQLDVKH
jgi:hypothetical protein